MRIPVIRLTFVTFGVQILSLLAEIVVANADTHVQRTTLLQQDDINPLYNAESRHVARKALISGPYRSGEIVSQQMWFKPGQRLKIEWEAQPAIGNCVISLFSIFNADLLFDFSVPESQRPAWSEIAIETFGGSAGRTDQKQFQTQYITQNDPNAPPTQRGTEHLEFHFLGDEDTSDVFDGQFHKFEIEFQAAGGSANVDAEIIYRLDGKEIRRVQGGDANLLEPPLDLYAGVWVTSSGNRWACTAEQATATRRSRELETVTEFPLNINCGGPAIGVFEADKYFLAGNKYALRKCQDVNCSERWGLVEYEVPVSIGEYTITMRFNEIYFNSANERIFDVLVEGEIVEAGLDPFARGNDVEITVVKTIADGSISISLQGVKENPKMTSFTIAEGNVLPPPAIFEPIKINCGGPAMAGFLADKYAEGGKTYKLRGCSSPECSERFGEMEYKVPVPNGEYTVTLSFIEIYFKSPGSRVFNVVVENQSVAENLDILAFGQGVVVVTDVMVTDGFVNIALTKVKENPKISSIMISPVRAAPVPPSPTPAPTLQPPPPLARPNFSQVVVKTIKVYEQQPTESNNWNLQKTYQFRNNDDLHRDWNLSDWGFGGFDGAFDPSSVVVKDNLLYLELEKNT